MLLPRSFPLSRPITAPQTAHVCGVPSSPGCCWEPPPLSPFNLASLSLVPTASSALVPANRAPPLSCVSCSLDRPLLCGGHLNTSEGILGPAWQCWTHGRENSNINGKFCGKFRIRLFDLVRNPVQRGPEPPYQNRKSLNSTCNANKTDWIRSTAHLAGLLEVSMDSAAMKKSYFTVRRISEN